MNEFSPVPYQLLFSSSVHTALSWLDCSISSLEIEPLQIQTLFVSQLKFLLYKTFQSR